jgi:hypothetical protein
MWDTQGKKKQENGKTTIFFRAFYKKIRYILVYQSSTPAQGKRL